MSLFAFTLWIAGACHAAGPPPIIVVPPLSQTVLEDTPVTFTVVVSSTTTISYQWRKNGTAIPGATQSSYTINKVSLSDAGVYSVTVVNGGGSVTSSGATLTVIGLEKVSIVNLGSAIGVAATNVSTRTWTQTVTNGDNRILIVGIALADTGDSVSSVTYGGAPLSRAGNIQSGNTAEIWYLTAPPVGSTNVVATWTGNRDMAGWSGVFGNVDQTAPVRNVATASGSTSTPTVTVASSPGDIVVDTLSANGDAISLSAAAGQTEIWQAKTGTGGADCWGAASHKAGATNVTLSWSAGAAKNWGIVAAALRAAPALQSDIITTVSGPSGVVAGANATFVIQVTNASSMVASNIILSDRFAGDAAFFSASAGGMVSNNIVVWPAFHLAGNSSKQFTVVLTASGSGTFTNCVSSTAATYDPDASNNSGSALAATAATTITPSASPAAAGSSDFAVGAATNRATCTWVHTVSGGDQRLLLVGIALADTQETVSSVTYGGLPLTRITATRSRNTAEMWCLVAPPVGSTNIVAVWTGNKDMTGWSGTFTNVDQTNPVRNFGVTNGSTVTPNITIAAIAGDLVVDTLSANGDARSLAVGTNQTQIFQRQIGTSGGSCWGAASFRPGTASVNMTWAAGDNKDWDIAAVVLKAGTPAQADVFAFMETPAAALAGGSFTCTIAVSNQGPQAADNLQIGVPLHAPFSFVSASSGAVTNDNKVVWTVPTLPSMSATNFSITLSPRAIGQFTNSVIAAADTSDPVLMNNSSFASITVTASPPSITSQPLGQTVAAGQSAALSVSVNGTGPLGYQWWRNGSPLPGANGATLSLGGAHTSDSGDYLVVVTNVAGSVTSATATVVVTNAPPLLSASAAGAISPSGFSFNFSIPAGTTFIVEASTNSHQWISIYTNTAAANTVTFSDPAAAAYRMRFYRVRLP